MVIESTKTFTKYLHSIAYNKTSLPKSQILDIYSDTIAYVET